MKQIVVDLPTMSRDIKSDFLEALRYHLYSAGYGSESKLARAIGRSPQYIGQLRKGEKLGAEQTRNDIAAFFEFTYEGFLEFGRKLNEMKNPSAETSSPGIREISMDVMKSVGAIEHRLAKIEEELKRLDYVEEDIKAIKKEMAPDTKQTGTDGAS
jgi:transcriptional regulator with XRE-family HTH domain